MRMHPFSIASLLGLESADTSRTDHEMCVPSKPVCHAESVMDRAAVCHVWTAQPLPLMWYPWMDAGTKSQGRKRSVSK